MKAYSARDFDPVFDSQRVFRILLQAAAQPGKLFTLPPFACGSLEAAARSLLDHEVTFCAIGERAVEGEERISQLTGARVSPAKEADFALISGGDSAGETLELGRGTLERPEMGATAIYTVEELSNTGTLLLEISGPGIPDVRTLGIEGLTRTEAGAIRETRLDYPLGVDAYLIDGAGRIAGLPRSTRLEVSV